MAVLLRGSYYEWDVLSETWLSECLCSVWAERKVMFIRDKSNPLVSLRFFEYLIWTHMSKNTKLCRLILTGCTLYWFDHFTSALKNDVKQCVRLHFTMHRYDFISIKLVPCKDWSYILQILFFHRLLQNKSFSISSFLCNLMFYTYHILYPTASSICMMTHKKQIQSLKLLSDSHWKLESFLKAHLRWRTPPRVGDGRHMFVNTMTNISLSELSRTNI